MNAKSLRKFRIKDDTHLIRPANTLDSFSTIASILYDANPEIFQYWFDNDRERGVNTLTYLCSERRTFFSYEHMIVVEDLREHKIVGIANIVDSGTRLDFNYKPFQKRDAHADAIITNYIGSWMETVKEYSNSTLFLPNISGDEGWRWRAKSANANKLMDAVIKWSVENGYDRIVSEYPGDDKPSTEFYRAHGFARAAFEPRYYVDGSSLRTMIATAVRRNHA